MAIAARRLPASGRNQEVILLAKAMPRSRRLFPFKTAEMRWGQRTLRQTRSARWQRCAAQFSFEHRAACQCLWRCVRNSIAFQPWEVKEDVRWFWKAISGRIMQPMIKVENLTKRYAGVTALNGVSFEVQRGEIVGFLGPNGAGKSTAMRILTGFIPASSGRVAVAGLDVFEHSLEVRERVGYMPENNPLYVDMRISEYLRFRAKLKGLPRGERKERIPEVLEMCGLKDVSHRIIGHLSKGYRQRVGLADALLAEPDLLDSRRTHHRSRSGADSPGASTHQRPRQTPHHFAFHAHPPRSGDDLQPRHHHSPRTHPRIGYTAESDENLACRWADPGGSARTGIGSAGQTARRRRRGIAQCEARRGRLRARCRNAEARRRSAREDLSGRGRQWLDPPRIDLHADHARRYFRPDHP